MQLQNAKEKFDELGIKLAAISYDSQAILMDFAKRHKIEFSLLADPDSQVIRSFNVLNTEAKGMNKGMAHPGFFYIDDSGCISRETFRSEVYQPLHGEQRYREALPRIDPGSEPDSRSATSSTDPLTVGSYSRTRQPPNPHGPG